MSLLAERLLAVHDALDRAGLPHAFGGAIALAYCTQEPRGTRDLDINVFVGAGRAGDVFDALPGEIAIVAGDKRRVARDGQVRVMWGETPVDLFFSTHDYHDEAAGQVRHVPFEGRSIPVLGCESLIVFKVMFNRTRDWADIEAMLEAGVDVRGSLEPLRRIMGGDDPAVARLASLASLDREDR